MSAGMTGDNPFELRPLDFGEVLDRSFKLYKRAWKPLLVIGVISALPSVILSGVQQAMVGYGSPNLTSNPMLRAMLAAERGSFLSVGMYFAGAMLAVLALLFLYPLITNAIIAICARVYLNQPTTPSDALRIAARRYWPMLGTSLLTGVILYVPTVVIFVVALIYIGTHATDNPMVVIPLVLSLVLLVMLLIPAYIVAMTYFAFTAHAVVVEQTPGGFAAIKRSVRLVNGRFWPLLGLGVVFGLIAGVLSWIVGLVTLPLTLLQAFVVHSPWLGWLAAILGGASMAFVMPFILVGKTLVYYDTRIRKEGFDLEMLARAQTDGREEQ